MVSASALARGLENSWSVGVTVDVVVNLFMALGHVRGIAFNAMQYARARVICILRVSMSGITNDRSRATVTHP